MSETKFTPGPWIVAGPSFGEPKMKYASCVIPDSEDNDGIDICEMPFDHYNPEQEANAHLIAAAPDMYKTLEWLLHIHSIPGLARGEIQKTLAKARGEG
jgi:hypothetical protein